jgi:hypothetical protein
MLVRTGACQGDKCNKLELPRVALRSGEHEHPVQRQTQAKEHIKNRAPRSHVHLEGGIPTHFRPFSTSSLCFSSPGRLCPASACMQAMVYPSFFGPLTCTSTAYPFMHDT